MIIEPSLFDPPIPPPISTPAKRQRLTEQARRALVGRGLMDDATGATRTARRARCSDCGAPVWQGISAKFGGIQIDADRVPLTSLGEAAARYGGWRTISLRFVGDRFELDIRDQFIIRGEPAGSVNNCDVLTIHKCGAIVDALPHGPSRIAAAAVFTPLPIDPPF